MLIKTSAAVTVQITIENATLALPANYPTGRHSEYTVTTSGSGLWEEYEFNFVNRPDPTVDNFSADRMVLLFAPNTNSSDDYVFDDLFGPEQIEAGLSLNNIDLTASLKVFPIPVNNQLTIDSEKTFNTIVLTDVSGKVIYSSSSIGLSHSIDFTKFAKGIYQAKIMFDDNSMRTVKIVK